MSLKSKNQSLQEENTQLKNDLEKNKLFFSTDISVLDTVKYHQKYTYTEAKIINNNYSKPDNFLTINRGQNKGIVKEMAVINRKGIIGITENVSNNYTRVQSILNKNSNINARLKGNTAYFGTLKWNSIDYNTVQLHDIPRQAPLKIGDTIETGGKSTIFPEGIPIGTVSKINKRNTANSKINVTLFNDMSNLENVYVVKNLHKQEIQLLENNSNE